MNVTPKRERRRTRAGITILLVVVWAAGIASARATTQPTKIYGGYINDFVACNPMTLKSGSGTPPGSVTVSCKAASAYNGGWTGITVADLTATIHLNGDVTGTFDEWLYGVYPVDKSSGGLHWRGTLSIDGATGGFRATAVIVGGTCDFAGSSGSLTYAGHELNGGYEASWIRPRTKSAVPCNPIGV